MSTPTAFPDPDEVLSHLDWVRGLAQKLVGDPNEAEDLRQEVWVLSHRLQRPGQTALKGWLSGILRNVIRDRRRATRTRVQHETRSVVDRARSLDSSAVVREVSMHQLVVERLMRLREPYRSTLLARFFEDLSHSEIAERDQVSIATVRSRLQRGLAELRSDLAEERHESASLLALLALQTWEPEAVALQSSMFSASIALATLGVAVAGAFLFLRFNAPNETRQADLAPEAHTPIMEGGSAAEHQGDAPQGTSERRALLSAETPKVEARVSEHTTVQVQVIDLNEQPVTNVKLAYLRFMPDGSEVRSEPMFTDAEGRARLEGVRGKGIVVTQLTDQIQLAFPNVDETLPGTHVAHVVLAPATALEGIVRAGDGTPLEGVVAKVGFLGAFPGAIGRHLAHANQPQFRARTDAEGRFRIRVPMCKEPMGLLGRRVGYEDTVIPKLVFDREPVPLEITMPAIQDPNTCFGKVLSGDGKPLVGAWVADGERVVRTMEGGAFQLGRVPDGAKLWVGAIGHEPKQVSRALDLRDITLELSSLALAIEGRVIYPDGSAAEGLQLRLRNQQDAGTHFYSYGGRQAFSELSVEDFAYPPNGTVPGRSRTLTDADGRFRLVGLLPRDYELELIDPNSLQQVSGLFFPAGASGVRIECPARPAPVSGTLRTPEGKALAGILMRSMEGAIDRPGPQARTDAEGRFHFDSLARGCRLWADVQLPWVHTGIVIDETSSLDIEVEPAARLKVTLDLREGFAGQERLPERLLFLDVAGARVPFVFDDIRFYRRDELSLRVDDDGFARPVPLIVPLRARELVLEGDAPVLVLPLDLKAGGDISITE